MEVSPPRGTTDLLPPRSEIMASLYDHAHRTARLFGYRYVETPTFEHTELFARTSGETSDVVTKEMYTFEDKGGRSVTLRPESTAPVVRAYLEHAQELPTPFKAYYVNTNFRHNRPQAGRLREFRVFGCEVIGTQAPAADVEIIAVADRYLRDRGLREVALHLNSIGDETCRPAYRERLIAYLEPHEPDLDEDCRARLHTNPLRVLDCKADGQKDYVRAAPLISDHLCDACAAHFAAVQEGLTSAGISFGHDPRLVRGLDYYTRTAFEFISDALSHAQAATVCGGGRYDGLAELMGGVPTPGIGFGMGLDRVLLALDGEGVEPPEARGLRCFVVALGEDSGAAAAALVAGLRAAGVSAASAFEDRPMKAQMRMADRAGADFAAIIGSQELAEGLVTLRRLSDGTQSSVATADVAAWLRREDGGQAPA